VETYLEPILYIFNLNTAFQVSCMV